MSESFKKLLEFSSQNSTQAADFQKFICENILADNEPLINLIAEVVAKNQDEGNDSNNKRLFVKLKAVMEEKGFADKIPALLSCAPTTFNKNQDINTAQSRIKFNRTLSLDRPCSPNSSSASGSKRKTATDGCFGEIIKIFTPRGSLLEPYRQETAFQFDKPSSVTEAVAFGSHPLLQSYSMRSKNRGVFLYVNIIKFASESKKERDGAEIDRDNLITLFKEMNFTVFYYEDLTQSEFTNIICQLIKSNHFNKTDSFVCCVQTHGDTQRNATTMEFYDGGRMQVDQVLSFFSNSSCPKLANKPKVFLFPVCRGSVSDKRIMVSQTQTDGPSQVSNLPMPSYNDILICYATVPGYQAHRDPEFGSWYVKILCQTLALHAHDTHLEDMLKLVSAKTMDMKDRYGENFVQVASTENRGFNKLLYFNPKKYESKSSLTN